MSLLTQRGARAVRLGAVSPVTAGPRGGKSVLSWHPRAGGPTGMGWGWGSLGTGPFFSPSAESRVMLCS